MHHTPIKVRGYHLDLYGHVNNARYLEFLEEARWAYFEATHGLEWFTESGLAFVVVNININYRRPAFMNEQLVVDHRAAVGQRFHPGRYEHGGVGSRHHLCAVRREAKQSHRYRRRRTQDAGGDVRPRIGLRPNAKVGLSTLSHRRRMAAAGVLLAPGLSG